MNLELKQLINVDNDILNTITAWMYNWWGIKDGYSFEAVKCFMQHSLQKDRLPKTYGLFLNDTIIGMFQLTYEDLAVRPDIYPWLANVYIDEKYRKMGYSKNLLEGVKTIAQNSTDFNELFLYTKHIGLYEKYGWKYISEIDTYKDESRVERLYKLDLKENLY